MLCVFNKVVPAFLPLTGRASSPLPSLPPVPQPPRLGPQVAARYLDRFDVRARLARLGLEASRAPNSIWFKNPAVNKALPVQFLSRHAERFGFAIDRAVAFGNTPAGNDAPLTGFVESGMAFVSVAGSVTDTPDHLQSHHVGGYEHGTAAMIHELASAIEGAPSALDAALVLAAVPKCRAQVLSNM